jgi:hypothetical protein
MSPRSPAALRRELAFQPIGAGGVTRGYRGLDTGDAWRWWPARDQPKRRSVVCRATGRLRCVVAQTRAAQRQVGPRSDTDPFSGLLECRVFRWTIADGLRGRRIRSSPLPGCHAAPDQECGADVSSRTARRPADAGSIAAHAVAGRGHRERVGEHHVRHGLPVNRRAK